MSKDCPSCPAFGKHCPHKVNGDPYTYDCYLTVAELEKENAELRSRDCWKSCEYANPKAELIGQHIKDVQNLTKAKEIINKFVELKNKPCAVGHSVNMLLYDNICAEAEQFLKRK